MKKNIIILCFFSFVVHLPILINNGIFWDDWTLFNMDSEGIDNMFKGAGAYNTGLAHFHNYLQQIRMPALLYHFLEFSFSLGSALLFYRILIFFKEIDKQEAFYMALLFSVLPFFSAKVVMMCLPSSICLFIFLLGFYLFVTIVKGNHFLLRLPALFLFFMAFTINSFLFLYLVLPLFVWYYNKKTDIIGIIKKCFRYADFMVLPVIFWIVKLNFFNPTGYYAYENYNEIGFRRFLFVPSKFAVTLNESFLGIASLFYRNAYPYLFLLLFLFLFIIAYKPDWLNRNVHFQKNENHKAVLLTGFFLFFCAAFPYFIVGKNPLFAGYQTRHQLLLPIGFSIITVSLIGIIKEKFKAVILVAILAIAIIVNLELQQQFLVGWFKQESIIANLKSAPIPNDYKTIEVIDSAGRYNPTDAAMTFYEWSGISKYVTGEQNRLLFTASEFKSVIPVGSTLADHINLMKQFNARHPLNIGDYFPDGTCHSVVVATTKKELDSWTEVLRLTYYYYLNRKQYDQLIGNYITLRYAGSCSEEMKAVLF